MPGCKFWERWRGYDGLEVFVEYASHVCHGANDIRVILFPPTSDERVSDRDCCERVGLNCLLRGQLLARNHQINDADPMEARSASGDGIICPEKRGCLLCGRKCADGIVKLFAHQPKSRARSFGILWRRWWRARIALRQHKRTKLPPIRLRWHDRIKRRQCGSTLRLRSIDERAFARGAFDVFMHIWINKLHQI